MRLYLKNKLIVYICFYVNINVFFYKAVLFFMLLTAKESLLFAETRHISVILLFEATAHSLFS